MPDRGEGGRTEGSNLYGTSLYQLNMNFMSGQSW